MRGFVSAALGVCGTAYLAGLEWVECMGAQAYGDVRLAEIQRHLRTLAAIDAELIAYLADHGNPEGPVIPEELR